MAASTPSRWRMVATRSRMFGKLGLPCKVVAKLELRIVEVKRHQSLEQSYNASYPSPLSSPNMTRRTLRLKPTIVALVALGLAVTGVACGDFTGVPASLPTVTQTGSVYALNGAPVGAPTALHVFSGTLLPANSSFVFDIAFDIDGAGNPVLLPQRIVATGLSSTHTVAMQKVSGDFDA